MTHKQFEKSDLVDLRNLLISYPAIDLLTDKMNKKRQILIIRIDSRINELEENK